MNGDNTLFSKHLRHPVHHTPNSSDLLVFNEEFVELEYRCFDALEDVGLVLDLGANVGYATTYFLSRFPNCFVIAVEPDPDNFAMLERNVEPYKDENRHLLIEAAVWHEETELFFSPENQGLGEEWGRMVSASGDGIASVKTVTIDSLLAQSGFATISILKMDIERSEGEVLSRNSENWLAKTDNFCIEIHGPENEEAFRNAIAGHDYNLSRSGLLTVGMRQR